MKRINFLLDGFGFENLMDFKTSSFGYITINVVKCSTVLSLVKTLFGVDWLFFLAYVCLIAFEWYTGVQASFKKGQKHQSRKLGRMILKIGVYSGLLFILNGFKTTTKMPHIEGFELNPFSWLYWIVLFVIIWQLLISVLENLEVLEFEWASKLIAIINIKVNKKLGLDDKGNSIE
ncbi:Holin [Tenacibaculum maritimum]|uniref:phage holin family protein n=1 Tax=Tenacibaculum maritimum TaxID=107401 RepID=UPI0012E6CAB7|nr:phage holin family protein [Tenacibaculum maritimum]MCD9582275.1 phage holin family protein [Tenacibaculum maritimum]MCD9636657.1 phage holin family protein [Tenacibaculum maritimum]CAA0144712.1 Holin [Tenacibaculum maritimum]CAA0193711.1 Holin [Tenacibaculum maritimum]